MRFVHNNLMSNVLQDIFKDHSEEMIYTLHPRSAVIENVDRMIGCDDPSFGGAMYGCDSCGTLKFVPFRCHSRFCPTCGTKYSIDRTTSMSFKIINVQHRHCVFTIDSELRHFFRKTDLFSVFFLRQSRALSSVCFIKITNPKILLPVSFWSFIPLGGISNGILISTVSCQRAVSVTVGVGVPRHILITPFSVMLSVKVKKARAFRR